MISPSLKGYIQTFVCLFAQSCLTFCDPMNCSPRDSSVHGDSLGKNTGIGFHAILQGIFPTKGSNPSHIAGRFFNRWATREVPFRLFNIGQKKHISVSQIYLFCVISQLPCLCSIASSTWKPFSTFSAWIAHIHSSRFSSCLLSSGKLSVCNSEWDRCQIFSLLPVHFFISVQYCYWFSCLSTLESKQFEIRDTVISLYS